MLRVVRRGDRHDPKDLTVSCRFEGDFGASFTAGRSEGLVPGEALKNLVHATARTDGHGEIESFGLALCERLLSSFPKITKVRVEIAEQIWSRLEIGGRAQGQAFEAGASERRTTAVTSNGRQIAVVSGIDQLALMRTAGLRPAGRQEDVTGAQDGLQRLLVGALGARWSYSSPDVTFGSYRQGVRAVIVETFAAHARLSVEHTLHAIAEVALASYPEIVDITLTMQERPYRPADLFSAGVENPDDLFLVIEEPLGNVEVTLERGRTRSIAAALHSAATPIPDQFQLLRSENLVQRRQFGADECIEPRYLLVEPRRQVLEHGVGLIGRPVVAALDDALQRCELVVQSNRIVERILAAAIPVLIDLPFDVGQLVGQRLGHCLQRPIARSCRSDPLSALSDSGF